MDNEDNTIVGYTSLVSPTKKLRKRSTEVDYKLTSMERKHLVQNQLAEFNDVLQVFFLKAGCQQQRIQLHLYRGHLVNDAANKLPPCINRCTVCNGEWDQLFLPVWKDAVIAWLDSADLWDGLPVKATVDNLFDFLWTKDHWVSCIFDKGPTTVFKYHLEAFLCNSLLLV